MESHKTVLLVSNLHCPTCSRSISEILLNLRPYPSPVTTCIVGQQVTVTHRNDLSPRDIVIALLEAGFEVDSISSINPSASSNVTPGTAYPLFPDRRTLLEEARTLLESFRNGEIGSARRHIMHCEMCRKQANAEASRTAEQDESATPKRNSRWSLYDAIMLRLGSSWNSRSQSPFATSGHANGSQLSLPIPVRRPEVNTEEKTLIPGSPQSEANVGSPDTGVGSTVYEASISIGGMTCAVCSGKIMESLEALPWVKSVNISLMTHSGVVVFDAQEAGGENEAIDQLVDEIECMGFDAALDTMKKLLPTKREQEEANTNRTRSMVLRIGGMHCNNCPTKILDVLEKTYPAPMVEVDDSPAFSRENPKLSFKYTPQAPNFTVRHVISVIGAIDPAFQISVFHPPSIEQRARVIQIRERKDLLYRLIFCLFCAIPTFLIGIVWMSLVDKHNPQRMFFEQPMWKGAVSRADWALLFLSTPVVLYSAEPFHRRAVREIIALWRKGSHVPVFRRLYRFGSMNLLISLGVTISYTSSIVMLGLATARHPDHMITAHTMTYFDSTVFLTFFLLIGRYLEAYSKAKTADAVSLISRLRPTEAVLLETISDTARTSTSTTSPVQEMDSINSEYRDNRPQRTKRISADLIEVGDIVCIAQGSSPPADAIVISGESQFDESSLTGEALLVYKTVGDEVYAGTINHGQVINARAAKISGESMIDQIVNVVREGQNKHAPIERIADQVTAYFVPTICFLAVSTWVIWLSLGISGSLPEDYLDTSQGGWYFWSLSFAIAVFVVACPCGIGLAAPCAMHVGSSLAARNAILAKGGGEAFQEASKLDVVVFDKTGTLTEGVEPVVSHEEAVFKDAWNASIIFYICRTLEENSTHPLARALVKHCDSKRLAPGNSLATEEIAGKGAKGRFNIEGVLYEAILGNERLMNEHKAIGMTQYSKLLESWKMAGSSVVLLAVRAPDMTGGKTFGPEYKLVAMFGTTDPVRPEARTVVSALQQNGIDVWMISGDNPTTSKAVAATLGIASSNVIAGVLPTEKADKVEELQARPPKKRKRHFNIFRRDVQCQKGRSLVAMVGDGINDSPALSKADVGIAIGSGSDIAMQTSKFILASSDLRSLFTLIHLSKAVINRVKFNFLWACVFNILAIPLAAGVLYPLPGRIRLSPVWAALTMALSSVSVVCCSLLLKTNWYGVGFRPRKLSTA